jgi:GTP-binding protein Era
VPPKNLTPYYNIPNEALAPIEIQQFESPLGSKQVEICILGAANAGKSSILNFITERNISAVSNKYNTTDEAKLGIYTDYDTKAQLCLFDTPGVTKASNSLKSKLLVSKAWNKLEDSDMVMFVVDSVRKLDFEVRESILRLRKLRIDPMDQKIIDKIKDGSFSEDKFVSG